MSNDFVVGRAALADGLSDDDIAHPYSVLKEIYKAGTKKPESDIVGEVIDAFQVPGGATYVVLRISHMYKDISWLIARGLNGLSMTHGNSRVSSNKNVVPYEVTLCRKPARPFCRIIYDSSICDFAHEEYKRQLIEGVRVDETWWNVTSNYIMSATAAAAEKQATTAESSAPTPAPAEPAINNLKSAVDMIKDENARRTVIASFGSLVNAQRQHERTVEETKKELETLRAAKQTLEEKNAELAMQNRAHSCSAAIMKKELGKLTQNISPEMRKAYGLDQGDIDSAFASDNTDRDNDIMFTMQRAITVCNQEMMQARANQVLEGTRAKRARETEIAPPPPAASATENTPAMNEDDLFSMIQAKQAPQQTSAVQASSDAMQMTEEQQAEAAVFATVQGLRMFQGSQPTNNWRM